MSSKKPSIGSFPDGAIVADHEETRATQGWTERRAVGPNPRAAGRGHRRAGRADVIVEVIARERTDRRTWPRRIARSTRAPNTASEAVGTGSDAAGVRDVEPYGARRADRGAENHGSHSGRAALDFRTSSALLRVLNHPCSVNDVRPEIAETFRANASPPWLFRPIPVASNRKLVSPKPATPLFGIWRSRGWLLPSRKFEGRGGAAGAQGGRAGLAEPIFQNRNRLRPPPLRRRRQQVQPQRSTTISRSCRQPHGRGIDDRKSAVAGFPPTPVRSL